MILAALVEPHSELGRLSDPAAVNHLAVHRGSGELTRQRAPYLATLRSPVMPFRVIQPICDCEASFGANVLLAPVETWGREPRRDSLEHAAFMKEWRRARGLDHLRLICPLCIGAVRVRLWTAGYPAGMLLHKRRRALVERALERRAASEPLCDPTALVHEVLPLVATRCDECVGTALVESDDERGSMWCPACDGVGWIMRP